MAFSTLLQPWIHPAFDNKKIMVDVLRLDLLHPIISGNKWLKLQPYLALAALQNKKGILTKGGPWSNYAHATAYACMQQNVACHLMILGNKNHQTPTLLDCQQWGATIHFENRSCFYNQAEALHFADTHNLLYVPLGGADDVGMRGVTHFFNTLHLPVYNYALCSVGTATTMGGLLHGRHHFNHIIGVDSGTHDEVMKQKITAWQSIYTNQTISLQAGYDWGGYAKHQQALIGFMNELYQTHKIPTDIVYTAKLFYAIIQMAVQHFFIEKSRLLIVHTGGLQGNRSLKKGVLQF